MAAGAHQNGLVAGVLTSCLYALVYAIDKNAMFSLWLYWGSLPVVLFFMIRASTQQVGKASSELLWKDLIRTPFLVFVVCNLIFWIFYYLLFTFDHDLAGISMARQLEALETMAEMMGDKLEGAQLAEMQSEIKVAGGRFSLKDLAFSFAKGVLGGFLLSITVALILRYSRQYYHTSPGGRMPDSERTRQ